MLRSLDVLDSEPETAYDRITTIAARLLDMPIALVSLVDEHRQWFKAKVGMDLCGGPRCDAFCSDAIADPGESAFVVTDASLDPRFADNPLVTGAPSIRFYAGQPLTVRGQRLGTLCVIDRRPRTLTESDLLTLGDLGSLVEELLERSGLQSVVGDRDRIERRKGEILATMHDGLVVQDIEGSIVEWNRAAELVLGLTADQLGGRSSIDPRWGAVHGDGTPWPGEDHPAMQSLRTGATVENATMGINRPGSGLGWLRVNSTPMVESDGRTTGVVTSFTDITELVVTEQQLRHLERLQRSTLDLLEQGVIVASRDGSIRLMNVAAQRILGYDDVQLSAHWRTGGWRTYREDGTVIDADEHPLARTFRFDERIDGEVVGWERPNGNRVLVQLSTAPIPDTADQYLITFSDVTERRRERQLLDLTFSRAPHGMALLDYSGRFISVNPAMCAFLERDERQLVGSHFRVVTHPDDRADDIQRVQALLDGVCDHWEMDKRYVRPDGTEAHAHLAVAIVRSHTLRHPYFIAQLIDIKERIAAERVTAEALITERAAVSKLVELDRIKSDFVSTVSHELRTPLTSMLGYIELLTEPCLGRNVQDTKMLGIVERNAHRLHHLIEDLLTLSQVEHDPRRVERTRVDVAALIAGAVTTIAPAAATAGICIRVDVGTGGGDVDGNGAQLERVLLNLLSNAVKFSRRGGNIGISADAVDSNIEISIEDNGIGISASELPMLFDQFFRAEGAQTNAIPGTGLGLTISRRIIADHGGTIVAASREGIGSKFVVSLPSVAAAP